MKNEGVRERLFKEYGHNEEGTWEIHGEDPNCDFGGYHHEPHLATVEGKYKDIVEYALGLSGFIGWGYGGSIKKVVVTKIDNQTLARKKELEEKQEELERQLRDVKAELGNY